MAVKNIKEIHNRILANCGGSNQSALEIEDDPSCANARARPAGSPTFAQPTEPNVEDSSGYGADQPAINHSRVRHQSDNGNIGNVTPIRTGGAIKQTTKSPEPAPVIDETPAENTEDPATEDRPETMHFMTWEIELGARIYKVPEFKLAELQDQPHSDKLKFFDDLEKAKVEAEAIFQRVAAKRTANGLPRSILEPILEDIKLWDEKSVPQYFL